MGNPTGIKMNWPLVAIAFAVIGVPMGIALIQDLGKDEGDEEILARIGQVEDIAADEETATEPQLENADDIAGRWQEPAMDQAFFDEVFLGGPDDTKPALRGPLAGLDWYAPRQPDLSRWPKASFELGIASVVIRFPDDGTAQRIFESHWGKPLLMVGTDDLSRRIWTDADAQLRLVVEQHDGVARATFSPCIPAADYIGYSGRFAFETAPILGATAEQLARRYGARFTHEAGDSTGALDCPGVEVSERGASCVITFERGKAARLAVTIDHMFDPDGGPHLFDALKSRLGEVRQQAGDEHGNTWTFDHGYTVTQVAGTAAITVERVAR
jgi:hypothetical protein